MRGVARPSASSLGRADAITRRGCTRPLSDPGHFPGPIGTLDPPVHWVGPGGDRFQATRHEGRGKLTGDRDTRYEDLAAALPTTIRFLDLHDESARVQAAGDAYDGWRHAVHVLLSEGLDCGGTAPLTPELVAQVRGVMGSDALEVLGAALHRAALAGAADHDRLAEDRLDRYAAGLGVEVPGTPRR